jgi:hypothetical protein
MEILLRASDIYNWHLSVPQLVRRVAERTLIPDRWKLICVCSHCVIVILASDVSGRPVTTEARIGPCGICGGQSGAATGLSGSSSGFPCQYHSTMALHTRITWGTNDRPVGGRSSETWSHLFDMFIILTSIRKIRGSNLGPRTSFRDWGLSQFPL